MEPDVTKMSKVELCFYMLVLLDRIKRNLHDYLIKAGFDPNQPRVPAGNPDGGQWVHLPGWRSRNRNEHEVPDKPIELIPRDIIYSIEGNSKVRLIDLIPNPSGRLPSRANIFIGGLSDESFEGVVRNSLSLNRNSYGYNYYTNWLANEETRDIIKRLPKSWKVN